MLVGFSPAARVIPMNSFKHLYVFKLSNENFDTDNSS